MLDSSFRLLPNHFSRREKILVAPDGRRFSAKTRMSLPRDSSAPKLLFVISGKRFRGRLAPTHLEIVNDFSQNLVVYRERNLSSEIAAWKAAVDTFELPQRKGTVFDVAWDHGPIPVVQIGTCNDIPVCVTPVVPERSQYPLFRQTDINDAIVLRVLRDHLHSCLAEYMADVADHLRSAFLRPKNAASQTCRKAEQVLETSVVAKIDFIFSQKKANNAVVDLRSTIIEEQSLELSVYSAAANIVRAAIACLRFCIGECSDPTDALAKASSAIKTLSDDCLESPSLSKCVMLLEQSPPPDELSPIVGTTDHLDIPWLCDLIFACRFIGELRKWVLKHGGAYPVFIFVSHHMAVYASDLFFKVFQEYSSKFGNTVVIWTGTGRQNHIQLAILAKIWLSDAHVLYLPNSLDRWEGGKKILSSDSDWTIEEIFYGALLEKGFHIVQADRNEKIKDAFVAQLNSYQWEHLAHTFSHFDIPFSKGDWTDRGHELASKISAHIRERIYSLHHPRFQGLTEEDGRRLNDGCIVPALKSKCKDMLLGFRLGIRSDYWLAVQGVVRASDLLFEQQQIRDVTTADIYQALQGEKRKDGHPITPDWISRVLFQLTNKKLLLGNIPLPLISKGPRRNRFNTYRFGLLTFDEEVRLTYRIEIKKEDIADILWKIIRQPVGEYNANAEDNLVAKRARV